MSLHTYTRVLVGSAWDIDRSIYEEIDAALPGQPYVAKLSGPSAKFDFFTDLTPGDAAILDALVAAHKSSADASVLMRRKRSRARYYDSEAEIALKSGFDYAAKQFLFDFEFFNALMLQSASLAYPVRVHTADNLDYIYLQDQAELAAFHLAAVNALRSSRDAVSVLKIAIAAATTVAEVDAV